MLKENLTEKKIYKITQAQLPLSCPMPEMTLWNKHPKVYLPIEGTGEAMCPYCSTHYILTDFSSMKIKHA